MTNRKTTKRALLSSILALVLCFAMLLGTTFAWFTDTATTNVSTIQAGTLDVVLLDAEGESLEGQTLTWQKAADGAQQEILWEPGCTYNLQPITIKNNGNLALKYKIVITGIQGDAELNNAIEWTLTNGAAAANAAAENEENEATAATPLETEYKLLPDESHTLTITGHMKEAAGNEYQGKTIDGIAITVYATQDTVEYDSNNNQYDAGAEYDVTDAWTGGTDENGNQTEPSQDQQPTQDEDGLYHIDSAAEFINYINAVVTSNSTNRPDMMTVVLDKSIDLNGYTFTRTGQAYAFSGKFDGKGHTVSNFKITQTDGGVDGVGYTGLFGYLIAGASVKNLTVMNATVTSNAAQVAVIAPSVNDGAIVDNCHVVNCAVSGTKKVGAVAGYVCSGVVAGVTHTSSVTNCSAKNCTVIVSDTREEQVTLFGYDNPVSGDNIMTGNVDKGGNSLRYGVTEAVSYVAPGVLLVGSTYEISSAAGLNWFNDQCNKQGNSFNYKTIKLMSDIDMKGANWLPAGQNDVAMYDGIDASYNTKEFYGTFDGNGKTISNISIKGLNDTQVGNLSAAQQQVYSVGFIGYMGAGEVKNLTIKNVEVTGSHYVGTIVGMAQSIDGDAITNCHVENATITCKHLTDDQCGDKAGGIIGNSYIAVTNCSVKDTAITAGRDAGQVIGCAQPGSSESGNTVASVTVSATTGCSDSSAGANIKNEIVGRVVS